MAQYRCAAVCRLLFVFAFVFSSEVGLRAAPTVWSGPVITFSKTGADPTNPADPLNQDRLTDNVWLTRGGEQGMFNIAPGHETGYVRPTSPADTQWATSVMPANDGQTIAAANWAQLSFTDWAPSYGGPGSALGANITTHNAVVHLLTDDIYLDLSFTNYVSGGDFTYTRSTAAAAAPTGDYNHNSAVDAGDYVVWRETLNGTVSPNGSGADGNADGTINPADYSYWRARFGNPAGAGLSTASGANVPEPASFTLEFVFLLSLACKRKTRSWTEN